MSEIFISYASEDRPRAEMLAKALQQQGWSVWWDRTLLPSAKWEEEIENELGASKCVVVLWSAAAKKSEWVRLEATDGLERGVLIPVLIEDVKQPLRFRSNHATKLIDWQGAWSNPSFKRLLDAVSAVLDRPASRKTPAGFRSKAKEQLKQAEETRTGVERQTLRSERGGRLGGRAEKSRRNPWRYAGVSILLFAVLLVLLKDVVSETIPGARQLSELVGFELDYARPGDGLDLRDVTQVRRLDGDQRTLMIAGIIVNVSDLPRPVPTLRATISDQSERVVDSWTFGSDVEVLDPGERVGFQTSTKNPPKNAYLSIQFETTQP